jgi:hypothetical protein
MHSVFRRLFPFAETEPYAEIVPYGDCLTPPCLPAFLLFCFSAVLLF